MTRLHKCGLALLAASLSIGCSGDRLGATLGPETAAVPLAPKQLVRLAAYERGGKIDIVTNLDAEQGAARPRLRPQDETAKAAALWSAVSGTAVGRPVEWSNAETGSHGYVEITREVAIPESDRMCREYRETFVAEGRSEADVGQACQLRDGSWWKIQG